MTGDYSITGGATRHFSASQGGFLNATQKTVTLTGTLAFTTFAFADRPGSMINAFTITFTGSYTATGSRYLARNGAYINAGGGGANYFPGSTAGSGTNFSVSPWGLYT